MKTKFKLKFNYKLKKVHIIVVASIVLAAANFLLYFLTRDSSSQIVWIGFMLVWLNLILSWLTYRRLPEISYLFIATSFLIELLIVVDIYWITSKYL